jgi:hypothetical protein
MIAADIWQFRNSAAESLVGWDTGCNNKITVIRSKMKQSLNHICHECLPVIIHVHAVPSGCGRPVILKWTVLVRWVTVEMENNLKHPNYTLE